MKFKGKKVINHSVDGSCKSDQQTILWQEDAKYVHPYWLNSIQTIKLS